MMDVFAKTRNTTLTQQAIESGIYPHFYANSSKAGAVATLNGQQVLMFGSCNYLGLSNHPDVRQAVRDAVDGYGTCSAGCRLQSGNLDVHVALESKLASYLGKEACVVFTTGYQASVGAIPALVQRRDVVLLDWGAHASGVDGARLSDGTAARFRHNDVGHLEALLKEYSREAGVLVVVDGVYSATGEIAPLREIVALKKRYEFRLLVDDAHGTGVLGDNGRGTAEYLGVENEVDLIAGSFGKSFGSTGGFVAGPAAVVDFIRHTATPLVHSTSMTPGDAAAAGAGLEASIREPERRRRVIELAQRFREELQVFPAEIARTVVRSPSAIVSLAIGDEVKTLCYWRRLYAEGLYVSPQLTPDGPSGKASLRISCTADHSKEDVSGALAAMRRAGTPTAAVADSGLDESVLSSLAGRLGSASARF